MNNVESRKELQKRLREKIKNGRELNQMKQRMSVPTKKAQTQGPIKLTKPGLDFSILSKMSDKELSALSSMADIEVGELRELAKLATSDNHKIAEVFQNRDQSAKMEGMERRRSLVERFEKEGKFPLRNSLSANDEGKYGCQDSLSAKGESNEEKEKQELHLIFAFMDRLQTDKSLNEEQRDKMRAMIMLYHKNRGLGKHTPSLEDWINLYGISPDEVLKKSTYKMANKLDDDDAELSDLSED